MKIEEYLTEIEEEVGFELNTYFMSFPWVALHPKLSDKSKVLYSVLTGCYDTRIGYCTLSDYKLSVLLSVDIEVIPPLLKNLSDNNFIKLDGVKRNRKIWIEQSL